MIDLITVENQFDVFGCYEFTVIVDEMPSKNIVEIDLKNKTVTQYVELDGDVVVLGDELAQETISPSKLFVTDSVGNPLCGWG